MKTVERQHNEQVATPRTAAPTTICAALDTVAAIARMNGNNGFYDSLLGQFADRYGSLDMVSVVSKRGPQAAQLSAHTIEGLAETIGATGLQRIAGELELAITDGRSDVQALARLFNKELGAVVHSIRKFLGGTTAAR